MRRLTVTTADGGDWLVFHEPGVAEPPDRWRHEVGHASAASRLVIFGRGDQRTVEVDVDERPAEVHIGGSAVALRGHDVRDHSLDADPALDPDMALRLLAARSLWAVPGPVTMRPALVSTSPPVDWHRPARYVPALTRWVEFVRETDERGTRTPRRLQYQIADELVRYLSADAGISPGTASLSESELGAFHQLFADLVDHVSDDSLLQHSARGLRRELQAALLLTLRGRDGYSDPVSRVDRGRALVRYSYLHNGPRPTEVTSPETTDALVHQKDRSIAVLGRPLLTERIVWLPSGATFAVSGAGRVSIPAPAPRRLRPTPGALYAHRDRIRPAVRDARLRVRAASPVVRRRFADCWLLMDRDTMARDNAEHLYRYLAAEHPGTNAWFVLRRSSPDWQRLENEGFQLIDYQSDEYFLALQHCVHLVSSQVDDYVVRPFRRHFLGRPGWRYTFLQHGVLRHDLSSWLNAKPIDLFVTSTPDELRSVVADGTSYSFTDLETRMVGLARHDRLRSLADTTSRELLLVLPTWRSGLLGDRVQGNERELRTDFWESPYARHWRAFLESTRLRRLCQEQGWQLTFVPHPNMEGYLATNPLPDHIVARPFSSIDIQEALAAAAAVVTDYSSLASDAAYLERPVVYYQFDRDDFFAASHFHRPGVWSYEHDGFGPVTESAHDAVAALETIAAHGVEPRYARRMREGFPLRDGLCCARTVAAITGIEGATT